MYDIRPSHLFKVFHYSSLRIWKILGIYLLTYLSQQRFPFLHKRMRHLLQVEANHIGHHLAIALNHVCQVHKSIRHLTFTIHHPCVLRLTQEAFQALADNRATSIEHEVGHIIFIITYLRNGLIHQRIHGLSRNEHRTLGLQEHSAHMTQCHIGDVGRQQLYFTFYGQFWR